MHILVAEDDPVSRELLRNILESEPRHTFAIVNDGEQAWKLLTQPVKPVDICIFDILMPHLDGLELLARMRGADACKNIPVILCTAANDRATVQRAAGLSAAGYVVKPYSHRRVLGKLAEVEAALPAKAAPAATAASARQRFDIDAETHRALLHGLALSLREWGGELTQKPNPAAVDRLMSRAGGLQGGCLMLGEVAAAQCVGAIKADCPAPNRLGDNLADFLEELEKEVSSMVKKAGFGAPAAARKPAPPKAAPKPKPDEEGQAEEPVEAEQPAEA